jgi:hypothetical protein
LKKSKAYDDLDIVANELTALIIEKFHSLIYGVKDNPIVPDGLFTLVADPFNLGVPEIFKLVVIICVQFMLSHLISSILLII